jgi:excisionase family DNA binding protein
MSIASQQQDTISLRNKKQAARFLNVSSGTLERLMRRGLPYIKLSAGTGAVRFHIDDLANFVEARRVRSGDTQ